MESSALQVVVLLGLAVWTLTLLARRLRIAAPIVLLLGGVPLAFVPWLADLRLEPSLVLFLFLPALLYSDSLSTSLREIRANLRVVILGAVVLVVVTAGAVAVVGHALGLSWPVAWILGAVLAPTDATAVSAIAGRMPRRWLTILRAESLINDGTALVILAIAVEAATGHAPIGPAGIAWRFVLSYAGGGAAGLIIGWLSVNARRRVHDTLLANTVSVLTPFTAFLLAEQIDASGVVAVVVAGVYISQAGSLVITAQDRIRSRAFWQLTTFLLNGTLFVLVGLQLRGALAALTSYSIRTAVLDALIVGATVIGTRLVWANVLPYVIRAVDRRPQQRLRRAGFRQRQPNAWAGFRGAVSLAAALSVPISLDDGAALVGRELIIVVTFGVILMTLLQGLALPAVLRWARFPTDSTDTEQSVAEREAVEAALRLLPEAASRLAVDAEIARLVRAELDERHAELADTENALASPSVSANGAAPDDTPRREQYRQLHQALVAEKRATVVRLRDERRIDDIVLRRVEAVLDAEELRLGNFTED